LAQTTFIDGWSVKVGSAIERLEIMVGTWSMQRLRLIFTDANAISPPFKGRNTIYIFWLIWPKKVKRW